MYLGTMEDRDQFWSPKHRKENDIKVFSRNSIRVCGLDSSASGLRPGVDLVNMAMDHKWRGFS
jgi:hypothetical protein